MASRPPTASSSPLVRSWHGVLFVDMVSANSITGLRIFGACLGRVLRAHQYSTCELFYCDSLGSGRLDMVANCMMWIGISVEPSEMDIFMVVENLVLAVIFGIHISRSREELYSSIACAS